MADIKETQADKCNLPAWWAAGYTGKGVTVWDCENLTTHGKNTRQRVLDSAPDANVVMGRLESKKINGVLQYTVNADGTKYDLESFIKINNVSIVNASITPAPMLTNARLGEYWQNIIQKYDLCLFASSGNDSNKKKSFDNAENGIWFVGAINDNQKRASYSNGGNGLDFVDYTGGLSGTSFSAPYLAGKAALVRHRFPNWTRLQVLEYIKNNCTDLGDVGQDTLYGNGVFILPKVKNGGDALNIKKIKVQVDGVIKYVNSVNVNGENHIRLRDMDDILGICRVDYDAAKNMPIVRRG